MNSDDFPQSKKRVVIVSIPRLSPNIQHGTLLLHNNLEKEGYDVSLYDCNLKLYKSYSSDPDWEEIEDYGIQQKQPSELSGAVWEKLEKCFEQWSTEILEKNPDVIGISVFTIESRNWCSWLCYYLKEKNHNVTILLGGRGLSDPGKSSPEFAKKCVNWQLADAFLNGESENEIVKYMENASDKINVEDEFFINHELKSIKSDSANPKRLQEYNIISNWYGYHDDPSHSNIDIIESTSAINTLTATRGCVKRCTFCDVHLLRPKFSMRDPYSIYEDIIFSYEKYGATHHSFTDDMINGSNSHIMKWLELLANYMEKNNVTDISWSSQAGIKNKKSTSQELFSLMGKTNARLSIGIDHFSDNVLKHMKKLYNSDDIFYFLENCLKFKIIIGPVLLIVGYPTETKTDFNLFLDGIKKCAQYKEIIETIDLGNLCTIPIGSNLESLSGMHVNNSRLDWYYNKNENLTTDERIKRRNIAEEVLKKTKIPSRKKRTSQKRIDAWIV